MRGGGGLMAINYPLQSEREKAFVLSFFDEALKDEENLYYYPKPNHYTEIDDFALFSLKKNLTPENLKIESLYRKGEIRRDLRGKLHTLIRKDKAIDDKIINKKFFYESRKLFNLSYQWKELEVSQEQREYDLIDKVEEFYPAPVFVNVATLNVCNLSCVMCHHHSMERRKLQQTDFFAKKQFLDSKVVYEIIDYLSESAASTPAISFIALGEPLLDDRLPDFIAYAKSKKIPLISLTTNGVLLAKKGKLLLDSGLNRLTISIDGATPETYKKIRGADLDKVEQGVRQCVEHARALNAQGYDIQFQLNCVLVNAVSEIFNEKELYLQKWQDCRDIIRNIYFGRETIYDKEGTNINRQKIANTDLVKSICSFPWTGFQVDCYGNVTVCCTMQNSVYYTNPISIGNIFELGSCKKVWHSEKARRLRQESLRGSFSDFRLCTTCTEKFKNQIDELSDKIETINYERF